MINIKRRRHLILFMAVAFIFLMGLFGCGAEAEEPMDETLDNQEQEEAEEDLVPDEDEDVDTEEENPYDLAEEIIPMDDRNVAMDENFSSVLEKVFEKDPKLVESGEILALAYVVGRVITADDVTKIRGLLEEEGYELVGTDIEEDKYELNLSAEILGQKYDGNIYVVFWTAEEGENAQKIEVRIL